MPQLGIAKKHGHWNNGKASPEYSSWTCMKARCYYSKDKEYKNYGGRGIVVCARWRNSFENFLADMGLRPKGTTLDRKNGDGNYYKRNCRWSTPKIQAINRRPHSPTHCESQRQAMIRTHARKHAERCQILQHFGSSVVYTVHDVDAQKAGR